jgi:hypothetical protein
MKNGGWLENYNDSQASAPEGMVGDGYSNVGRNYSPAWGGQFQEGGEIPMAQKGYQTSKDSVAHQADKILKYEVLRGGPGSVPLDGTNGNPDYRDPKYRKMLMDKIYPEVQKIMPKASAMETGEAMDFIFNAGWDKDNNKITKDPRAFALQEYYRQNDKSKLDKDGKWSGRKNAAYSFDDEYANTIGKLPENQRRLLMNKGRDWYYKNINNPSPGVPSSDYNDTWYGRIWNTNDYNPFNPNNPKFTPKKQMGGNVYPVNYVPQAAMGASMPGAVGFTYARTNDPAPSEGPYAKKTMPSAQVGKKIKIKDERGLVMKPSESTAVKRKDFDLLQSKDNKAYNSAVVAQNKEAARRAKLTKEQREREDYNAYAQEHGNISKYTPETTWERTKAIVSNPMTAAGYVARGENLPGRFQYGPRNPHDYAVDWINPLQSAAALSNIPGQLGRGEFLDAGLSALDAADLGIMSKGLKKVGTNQLRNLSPAMGYRDGGTVTDYPIAQNGKKFDFSNGPAGNMKQSLITAINKDKKQTPNTKERNTTVVDKTSTKQNKQKKTVDIPLTEKERLYNSINNQARFMKDWMDSPMYDEMVDNSTTGYFDEQYLNSGRNFNFNNTRVQLHPQPKNHPNYGADSNNETGLIRLFPAGSQSEAVQGMLAHEFSHSSDKPTSWQDSWVDKLRPVNKYNTNLNDDEEEVRLIPEKDINLMKSFYSNNKTYKNLFNKSALKNKDLNEQREWFNYVSEPTETRARLNDIRYNAKIHGIYDPFTQKVTPEILNEIKELTKKAGGFDPFNQLQGVYSDEEILKLLNTVSQNEQPNENPNIATAKYGRVIKDDRGQWDHPGEITEINSNVITMKPDPKTGKPLTKPLLGISDTGDVKLMRPGGNYKFDGKRVTEYPIAQEGKDIKLKNKKGKVEIINTASPEYEKLYKAGEIQSADAGEGDNPFFGGQLPEVVLQQQMTPLLKGKIDYGHMSNKDAYINRKKDEYIKSLGSNNWFGASRSDFPENVLRDINAEYNYNQNTRAIEDVAKAKGFDLNTRGNWIYNLTPSEKEALINSRYSGQLNPNEFAEMASGIQQLGNTILPGKPLNFNVPGLTQRELEEDRESMLSPLKTLAPLNLPGNAIANYLKNSSDYVDNPFLGTQRMGNVDVWDSMAFNPLSYVGVEGLVNLPGAVTKGARTLATIGGENISNIKKAIPAVKEVVKELPKAIKKGEVPETVFKAMPDEFKQSPLGKEIQGTIDQREILRNMKKDLQSTLDVEGRDQIRYDGLQGPWDLQSEVQNIDYMFRRTMTDIGGRELADIGMKDMVKFQSESPAFKRYQEIIFQNSPTDENEMRMILKELADTMPKATNYTKEARKAITLRQKDLLYNKKDVKDLKAGIKATAKNTINKIKGKDTPDISEAAPVNYSPEEEATLDTIKELGKYRSLFSQDATLAKSHPQTMENVNNLISKLDDDVVRNVLGVDKQELINSYRNIAPNVKQAEANAAMAQKPFGLSELQAILPDESNNALRDLYMNKYDAPYTSEPSLVSKINKRKALENLGYELEAPSSYPQNLINYVATNYELNPDSTKPIMDAAGNVIDYERVLSSAGNAKAQIKNAINTVNNALPGENVIGSSSLSTDSYALTLDAALPYVKKGRLEVKVDVDPQVTNSMGYATRFPGLALKDINSKIEAIEKASGVKIPRAKYNKDYNEYDFPRIYFTKIKKNGGYIDRAKHGNQLVKLDQLTNFTNYNKPQPGGWLSKYE